MGEKQGHLSASRPRCRSPALRSLIMTEAWCQYIGLSKECCADTGAGCVNNNDNQDDKHNEGYVIPSATKAKTLSSLVFCPLRHTWQPVRWLFSLHETRKSSVHTHACQDFPGVTHFCFSLNNCFKVSFCQDSCFLFMGSVAASDFLAALPPLTKTW